MNETLSVILLILYVFLLPVFLLWMAHLLSVKLRRALTWIGPVVYLLFLTAILMHDVLNNSAGPGLTEKWNFYIHSDASIGMAIYGIGTTVCILSAASYYIARAVIKHRGGK